MMLDDLLHASRNRIDRIGIELEGGWETVPASTTLEHDGSVVIPAQTGLYRGEIPSPPMKPAEWEAWVRRCYPPHVNHTCGLHVHMSFKGNLRYQRLMKPEFITELVRILDAWGKRKKLKKDHPLWARLTGQNRYCMPFYAADHQARAERKGSNRYAAVNYCYGQHQTVEVRILPMFSDLDRPARKVRVRVPVPSSVRIWSQIEEHPPAIITSTTETRTIPGTPGVDLAVSAIQEVLAITNAFLRLDTSREVPERSQLFQDDFGTPINETIATVI
jgi:hypothetical protein